MITLALFGGVPVVPAVLTLLILGALFGVGLYMGSRIFHVELDPRIDRIVDNLPGANCGACGFPGCRAYAESIALNAGATGLCPAASAEAQAEIARIMGVEARVKEPQVAVVHCQGGTARSKSRGKYAGVADCRAALVGGAGGGDSACPNACLGLGSCVAVCPFDAMVMGSDGLPQVLESLCTGCGKCVEACPRAVIKLHDKKTTVHVMCSSREKARAVRQACEVGCIGCKLCEKACKFDAIKVVDNLAMIDDDKCKNCAACVKACPQGTIWNVRKLRRAIADRKKEPASAE